MPLTREETEKIGRVDYSEKELVYRDKIIEAADHARNQRSQKWAEFDDMDYETWYWKAKKANEAYIEPKRNKEDVKVVTGTTREKSNTLLSTLLNYNIEADITVFDDNNMADIELAQTMEAMVKKSRTLELPEYDAKRPLIYKELVSQGNAFVEEQFLEYVIPEKELNNLNWSEKVDPSKISWKKKLGKAYSQCNSSFIIGLDFYPGNMREFFVEKQSYIVVRRRISRIDAENIYQNWTRWKYVPFDLSNILDEDESDYDDYQMVETEVDFIEEIKYYNKWTNEYMVMLNGVLMLPVGFPLSALLGVCEYPIAKGDSEPISANFFYSRGIGAKTRMDQAIVDEMFKMMIVKTRKSYKPPMGNRTGYTLGSEIYMPAKIFKNVDAEKLKPIGDNKGVTPAEFNMMEFTKSVIDSKTLSPIMEGQKAGGRTTAREIIEMKQQSMVKIGLPMLGVINMEKRIAWLRICNILKNWTDPVDQRLMSVKDGIEEMVDVYRTIDVEDTFETGQEGRKIVEMKTGDLPESGQMMAEEEIIERKTGQPTRKIYINPEKLKNLKYQWFVNVTPTEKNSGMLKAAKFEEFVQKATAMLMPLGKQLNADYVGDRMALLNEENPEKIWMKKQPGQPPPGQPGQGPNELGQQLQMPADKPDLSLNALMQ